MSCFMPPPRVMPLPINSLFSIDRVTPWPQLGSSAAKKLKRFTDNILRKAPSPLLPQSVVEAQPKLPIRNRRIAAQPLSR